MIQIRMEQIGINLLNDRFVLNLIFINLLELLPAAFFFTALS